MEAWERSELAGVGEGFCLVDRAHPLTQLQLGSVAAKLSQPSPDGRGIKALSYTHFPSLCPVPFLKKDACHEPSLPPPPR